MIRPFRGLDRRTWYQLAIGGLVFLAWIALVVWGASPFGKYLSHEPIGESGVVAAYLLLSIAGWVLMTMVMMLPSSLPLIDLFVHMIARRKVPFLTGDSAQGCVKNEKSALLNKACPYPAMAKEIRGESREIRGLLSAGHRH